MVEYISGDGLSLSFTYLPDVDVETDVRYFDRFGVRCAVLHVGDEGDSVKQASKQVSVSPQFVRMMRLNLVAFLQCRSFCLC